MVAEMRNTYTNVRLFVHVTVKHSYVFLLCINECLKYLFTQGQGIIEHIFHFKHLNCADV